MDRQDLTLQISMSEITELMERRGSSAKHALPLHIDSGSSALISQGDWHPPKTELPEHQVPSAHSHCDITRTHDTTPLSLQPSQVRLERHTKITWLCLENPCASAAKYSTYLAVSGLTAKKTHLSSGAIQSPGFYIAFVLLFYDQGQTLAVNYSQTYRLPFEGGRAKKWQQSYSATLHKVQHTELFCFQTFFHLTLKSFLLLRSFFFCLQSYNTTARTL